jgi:hypothetical protein
MEGSVLGPHLVRVVIDVPPDEAPADMRDRIAARSAATVAGACPYCDCTPEVVGEDWLDGALAPTPTVTATVSHPSGGPHVETTAAYVIPSVSESGPTSQRTIRRQKTELLTIFRHHADCPAYEEDLD